MANELDAEFFDRADALINLANCQIKEQSVGIVSASFMYAAARFNAWVYTASFPNADELRRNKSEIVQYLANQYRSILEENLDDYSKNFPT